jgi:hypothetical protein
VEEGAVGEPVEGFDARTVDAVVRRWRARLIAARQWQRHLDAIIAALPAAERQVWRAWRARMSYPPVALPVPDAAEVAVLRALASCYGPALLDTPPACAFAVGPIAQRGGVYMAQRALWGPRKEDAWLRMSLAKAMPALEQIAAAYPVAFFADARAALARFGKQAGGRADG